jgi:hypothetical protein
MILRNNPAPAKPKVEPGKIPASPYRPDRGPKHNPKG